MPVPDPPVLPCDAAALAATLFRGDRRALLFGPPGAGKSTLAAGLADALIAAGRPCLCLSADPGSPAFGPPGALSLAARDASGWRILALEPLCTLDAGRFRLPLVGATGRLAERAGTGVLLVDAPGVARGVPGRELLAGLVQAARVDLVLALIPPGRAPPLADELAALPVERVLIPAPAEARPPGRRSRARTRTAQWEGYLCAGVERELELAGLPVLGTPPPADAPGAWVGRQVALIRDGRPVAMGEVLSRADGRLTLRLPAPVDDPDALLVRDALRCPEGLMGSAAPFAPEPVTFLPPAPALPGAEGGPRPAARVGELDLLLVNGLLGDPLLHARLRHQARSLLFDLGEGERLSARVAHQVTDVFVTHAHMDHLAGFLWLLRSRIGDLPPCRLYGPPGLAGHIRGLVDGFLWDRVGERGPAFEVAELDGDGLRRFRLRAGVPGMEELAALPAPDGVLREEPGFRIRAVTLDHHTPVLAYAFEPEQELRVRKDRLQASGLAPGPWLTELKGRLGSGEADALIEPPDGTRARAGALGRELVLSAPGKRLVYATDLADTPDNRERLIGLARGAHTLFLEAAFREADASHALTTGHLTGRACGEIGEAAGVARLVPFHLSRRYADDPGDLLDEVASACGRTVRPPEWLERA